MATKKRVKKVEIDWLGGIVSLPGSVTGEGDPYRPEVLLWLTSDGLIVGMDTARPGELLGRVVEHFRQTARKPMSGPPHVPASIRVASEELASALRAGLGDEVTIVQAPTPELDLIVNAMNEQMMADEGEVATTYLAPGIEEPAMAAFFRAAAGLYESKPWTIAPDDESLLLISIPAFELREAVICFMGQLGESFGLILFPNLDAYEAFLDAAIALEEGGEPELPPHFALNFEPGTDINPELRDEVARHGWKVASPAAYPWLTAADALVMGRPPTPIELSLGEVLALALPPVLTEKEALLRAWKGEEAFTRTLTVEAHAGSYEVTLRAIGEAEIEAHESGSLAPPKPAPRAPAPDKATKNKRKAERKKGR
jgi:uncharacterized protein DUF6930